MEEKSSTQCKRFLPHICQLIMSDVRRLIGHFLTVKFFFTKLQQIGRRLRLKRGLFGEKTVLFNLQKLENMMKKVSVLKK